MRPRIDESAPSDAFLMREERAGAHESGAACVELARLECGFSLSKRRFFTAKFAALQWNMVYTPR
jgi:hypothetical protein